jgi:hypothetical protein
VPGVSSSCATPQPVQCEFDRFTRGLQVLRSSENNAGVHPLQLWGAPLFDAYARARRAHVSYLGFDDGVPLL